MSRRTLFSVRAEYGLVDIQQFTDISDQELDESIANIKTRMPNSGQNIVRGTLRAQGISLECKSQFPALTPSTLGCTYFQKNVQCCLSKCLMAHGWNSQISEVSTEIVLILNSTPLIPGIMTIYTSSRSNRSMSVSMHILEGQSPIFGLAQVKVY